MCFWFVPRLSDRKISLQLSVVGMKAQPIKYILHLYSVCVYPAMKQRVSVENSLRNSLIMALIKNFWHFTWRKLHAPLYSHTCSLRVDFIILACKSGWGLKDTENPWLRWDCPFLISATGDVLNIQDLIHFFSQGILICYLRNNCIDTGGSQHIKNWRVKHYDD